MRITTCLLVVLLAAPSLFAQQNNNNNNNNNNQAQAFGICVDPEGQLVRSVQDQRAELARLQKSTKAGQPILGVVSISKTLAKARECLAQGQPLPEEVRYLNGLVQIRYLIVDPEQHDISIAGPIEPWDAANPVQPRGKQTARPVLQFDDLVVALRNGLARRAAPFGCSIDPAPHAVEKGLAALKENPNAGRSQLAVAVAQKLGPQPVRFFGIAPDTRIAFICVAADYQLKHYTLGLETIPVPGAGIPVDSSRPAGNGFWFEAAYEPLLVSPDGNIYGIRGPRLQVKAGAIPFDARGATERAITWSKTVSANMDRLASAMPIFADVQNFADLSLVASLIRLDKLEKKAGVDLAWALDSAAYQPAKVPTPRTAQVLTNYTNGSLVAGGVQLSTDTYAEPQAREQERAKELDPARKFIPAR